MDNGLEKSYIETLKEEIVDLTGKNTPGKLICFKREGAAAVVFGMLEQQPS